MTGFWLIVIIVACVDVQPVYTRTYATEQACDVGRKAMKVTLSKQPRCIFVQSGK